MNRKKAWKTDLERPFFSKFFWIAVVLFPVSDLLTVWASERIVQDVVNLVLYAESDGFAFLSYVLFAIPYAYSYCQDLQNHFVRYHAIRTGAKSYVKWKLVGCALSSGGAAMLGKTISFCILASQYPMFTIRNGQTQYGQIIDGLITERKTGIVFVMMLLFIFLKGLFFGCFAWMISTWIPNMFFVYTVPMVFDRILSNVFSLFPNVYAFLSPSAVYNLQLNGHGTAQRALLYAVSFTLVWLIIFYRISYSNMKRRLENG